MDEEAYNEMMLRRHFELCHRTYLQMLMRGDFNEDGEPIKDDDTPS